MSETGSNFFSRFFGFEETDIAELPQGLAVIDPGDMFWQPGSSAGWRVERLCKLAFTDADHVILQRVNKWGKQLSGDVKVIALESLLDPSQYQRERRHSSSQANGGDSGQRRRRGDAPKAN